VAERCTELENRVSILEDEEWEGPDEVEDLYREYDFRDLVEAEDDDDAELYVDEEGGEML
jgi:hypothetical protein